MYLLVSFTLCSQQLRVLRALRRVPAIRRSVLQKQSLRKIQAMHAGSHRTLFVYILPHISCNLIRVIFAKEKTSVKLELLLNRHAVGLLQTRDGTG